MNVKCLAQCLLQLRLNQCSFLFSLLLNYKEGMRWWEKRSQKGGGQGEALSGLQCDMQVAPTLLEQEEKLVLTDQLGRREAFYLKTLSSPLSQGQHWGLGGTRRDNPAPLLLLSNGGQSSIPRSPSWSEESVLENDPSLNLAFLPLYHGQFLIILFF